VGRYLVAGRWGRRVVAGELVDDLDGGFADGVGGFVVAGEGQGSGDDEPRRDGGECCD